MADAPKEREEERKEPGKSGRKPYEKPRLETYGNIREIAQASALMGMMDNEIAIFRSR
jgi:hypothetical protein